MPPTASISRDAAPAAVIASIDAPPRCGFVLRCVDRARWRIEGELDWSSGPLLLTAAEITLPDEPVMYLDCSGVQFVDVAGWRALRRIRLFLEPHSDVRLCHPSPILRRLIAVIGHP